METNLAPRPRALVVDDEAQILLIMRFALEAAGFEVVGAADGAKAWTVFCEQAFDLVVLDLMLPVIGGLALTERIRARSDVPIMMITALGEESDRITGLETGADDYLTKPFSPRELTLRAQKLVSRYLPPTQSEQIITTGDLTVNLTAHQADVSGILADLSTTEMRFLETLAKRIGTEVTYRDLLAAVWDTAEQRGAKDMIKMTAYRLRQALGKDGKRYIQSVRGVGYMMPRL